MRHCHFWIAIADCDRLATDLTRLAHHLSPHLHVLLLYHIHIYKSNNDNDMQETCMDPLMCLQVRALGVHFTAAREIAVVDPPLLQFRVVASVVLDRSCYDQLFFIALPQNHIFF